MSSPLDDVQLIPGQVYEVIIDDPTRFRYDTITGRLLHHNPRRLVFDVNDTDFHVPVDMIRAIKPVET